MESIWWSFGLATLLTIALGAVIIPILRRVRAGQQVRPEGPQTHLAKSGTPTMGGITFLVAVTATVVWVAGFSLEVVSVLAMMWGVGMIGLTDDLLKVARGRSLGLKARHKLGCQFVLGLVLAVTAVLFLDRGTYVVIPAVGYWEAGWLYFPLVILVVMAATNAVNLTDGLDGLAAGVTLVVATAYIFLSIWVGKPDLAVVAAALAGGCLGFLVYNFYPARVFMGDTGSLALGAAVAALAVLTRSELLLVVIGGVYVVEAVSVILQVFFFKIFRRRLFLMSPLHHHFELAGWSEPRVVVTFWGLAIVMAVLGLYLTYWWM